jgi:hypothetical protein
MTEKAARLPFTKINKDRQEEGQDQYQADERTRAPPVRPAEPADNGISDNWHDRQEDRRTRGRLGR